MRYAAEASRIEAKASGCPYMPAIGHPGDDDDGHQHERDHDRDGLAEGHTAHGWVILACAPPDPV